ncbi:MAG: hypothetical protein E7015_03995 [Alphaproteobacteria bacterium]|nr:hypothetical protein [Alphaproteobacteria bacterium]
MYCKKLIAPFFAILFVSIFSSDTAFGMRKRNLSGRTGAEKEIVQTLEQKKEVTKECVINLITEKQEALVRYIDNIVLSDDESILYVFENIDLKKGLINSINKVDLSISDDAMALLKREANKYEQALMRYISNRANALVSSLFSSEYYSPLIDNVLSADHLYGQNSSMCFNFIRRMTDLANYDCYLGLPKYVIDSNFNRIFPCSRRLMIAVCFDEFIRRRFYPGMSKADLLKYCTTGGDSSSEFVIVVESIEEQCEKRQVVFKHKESGVNPGYIVNVDDNNRFFIKMFHLANYKKRKGSDNQKKEYGTRTYVSDSLSFQASLRSSETSATPIDEFELNLREPFLYTVLDILGLGPEFNLIINPYVYQGIYIATKDVSSKDTTFFTFKEIGQKIENKEIDESILSNEELVMSINELDFFGKLFGLRDLHCENFGFLFRDNILQHDSLKIVDFVYPNSNFGSTSVLDSFLKRETTGLDIGENTLIGESIRRLDVENALITIWREFNERISKAYATKFPEHPQNIDLTDKFSSILSNALETVNGILTVERGTLEESMLSWKGRLRTNAELIGLSEKGWHTYQSKYEDLQTYIGILNENYAIVNNHINFQK